MRSKNRKSAKSAVGQRLIEALREVADAVESGEPLERRFTVRTVEIAEPGEYDAKRIRSIRDQLGVSQPIFARLLGVSTELIQHWEQGITSPRPIARRLLDEISRDPGSYFRRAVQRSRMSA